MSTCCRCVFQRLSLDYLLLSNGPFKIDRRRTSLNQQTFNAEVHRYGSRSCLQEHAADFQFQQLNNRNWIRLLFFSFFTATKRGETQMVAFLLDTEIVQILRSFHRDFLPFHGNGYFSVFWGATNLMKRAARWTFCANKPDSSQLNHISHTHT